MSLIKALRAAGAADRLYHLPIIAFMAFLLVVATANLLRNGNWAVGMVALAFAVGLVWRVNREIRVIRAALRDLRSQTPGPTA